MCEVCTRDMGSLQYGSMSLPACCVKMTPKVGTILLVNLGLSMSQDFILAVMRIKGDRQRFHSKASPMSHLVSH